jgi:hypothetical protein
LTGNRVELLVLDIKDGSQAAAGGSEPVGVEGVVVAFRAAPVRVIHAGVGLFGIAYGYPRPQMRAEIPFWRLGLFLVLFVEPREFDLCTAFSISHQPRRLRMTGIVVNSLVGLVAILHLYFLVLEMFF